MTNSSFILPTRTHESRESTTPCPAAVALIIRRLHAMLEATYGTNFAFTVATDGRMIAASSDKTGVILPVGK